MKYRTQMTRLELIFAELVIRLDLLSAQSV